MILHSLLPHFLRGKEEMGGGVEIPKNWNKEEIQKII